MTLDFRYYSTAGERENQIMARNFLFLQCGISLFNINERVTASVIARGSFPPGTSKFGNTTVYYLQDSDSCSDFCSPWVYCDRGECKCGEIPYGILQCDVRANVSLLNNNCLTYNKKEHLTELGKCLYTSSLASSTETLLPKSLPELDYVMCGQLFNRTGTLCGKCKDNYYPLAYSFEVNCIQCPDGKANWWKYVLIAYFPLTLFYFIVLLFKINAASSSLFPFVLCAQAATSPIIARAELIFLKYEDQTIQKLARWIIMLYGIWNPDLSTLEYA